MIGIERFPEFPLEKLRLMMLHFRKHLIVLFLGKGISVRPSEIRRHAAKVRTKTFGGLKSL
jgi:hypothetical protein